MAELLRPSRFVSGAVTWLSMWIYFILRELSELPPIFSPVKNGWYAVLLFFSTMGIYAAVFFSLAWSERRINLLVERQSSPSRRFLRKGFVSLVILGCFAVVYIDGSVPKWKAIGSINNV